MFDDRVDKIKNKIVGELIIKEYPTPLYTLDISAHCWGWGVKQDFKPDIIYVDLNMCESTTPWQCRCKFTPLKKYCRRIAWTGVLGLMSDCDYQTTRGGYNNSDVDLPTLQNLSVSLLLIWCSLISLKVRTTGSHHGETMRMVVILLVANDSWLVWIVQMDCTIWMKGATRHSWFWSKEIMACL